MLTVRCKYTVSGTLHTVRKAALVVEAWAPERSKRTTRQAGSLCGPRGGVPVDGSTLSEPSCTLASEMERLTVDVLQGSVRETKEVEAESKLLRINKNSFALRVPISDSK